LKVDKSPQGQHTITIAAQNTHYKNRIKIWVLNIYKDQDITVKTIRSNMNQLRTTKEVSRTIKEVSRIIKEVSRIIKEVKQFFQSIY
jgi:hypothetical protein